LEAVRMIILACLLITIIITFEILVKRGIIR